MNYAEICIIKRDGKREDFSISKIKNAISKAFSASGIQDEQQLVAFESFLPLMYPLFHHSLSKRRN